MEKITIGLFNDSYPPMVDGVGMVVDNYAKRLANKANVVVVVPRYKKPFDDSAFPYRVIRCRSITLPCVDYSLPLPLFDRKFRKEVKSIKFDIIHIHSPFSLGKFGLKIGRKLHIPVVSTIHSQFKKDFLRAIKFELIANIFTKKVVKVFDACDRCFAVNSGMADLYFYEYGTKRVPEVLSNATEMEYVKDKDISSLRINEIHNINKKDKVFLFVGRMNKLKNIFFIVDSLALLSEKKLKYKYKMLFVGNGQDFVNLKIYINKKKMNDNIILCGAVKDRELLRDYYVRSDLFLFPSLYDASSIVQIEAASQKVPTVFLKGSKTSSDITDRENGFLADSEISFANIIDEAMTDKKLYNKVSEGAYKDVYRNWDMIVDEVYDIYGSLIEKR